MSPRGIRNCNPGNIRRGAQAWQGESTLQDDPDFIRFDEPVMGVRALMRTLLTYYEKYDLFTVKSIISRWAPPRENATDNYIFCVCKAMDVKPYYPLELLTPETMIKLAQAIVVHENGKCPDPTLPFWYDDSVYHKAAAMVLPPTA